MPGDLKELGSTTMKQQIQALGSTLTTIQHWAREHPPASLTTDAHPFKPGDAAWGEKKVECPTPEAPPEGPFTVILSTPTAVKVAEVVPWIHHSSVKPASQG